MRGTRPTSEVNSIKIHFKNTRIVHISKGFHQSIDGLKLDATYVITPGGERYDRSDGLRICPLEVFLEREAG